MKLFIKKILAFVGSGLLVLLLLFFSTRFIERSLHKDILPASLLAVVGNSHAKSAIDDRILTSQTPFEVKNYGVNGQSMFWTIIAARKLYHQGVRTFVIELNNGSYTSGWKTTDPARGSREFYNKHFLTTTEWQQLWQKDPKFTLKMGMEFSWPSSEVKGAYQPLQDLFKADVVTENKEVLNSETVLVDFDDEVLHTLLRTQKDAHFFILRAPQHPQFYQHFSQQLELAFHQRLNSFRAYSNVTVFDFGHSFSSDTYFADLGHMNAEGARTMSRRLADSIQKYGNVK